MDPTFFGTKNHGDFRPLGSLHDPNPPIEADEGGIPHAPHEGKLDLERILGPSPLGQIKGHDIGLGNFSNR